VPVSCAVHLSWMVQNGAMKPTLFVSLKNSSRTPILWRKVKSMLRVLHMCGWPSAGGGITYPELVCGRMSASVIHRVVRTNLNRVMTSPNRITPRIRREVFFFLRGAHGGVGVPRLPLRMRSSRLSPMSYHHIPSCRS
jgi:hypothetical protein